MRRQHRVRRYARPECTVATLARCRAEERECRYCPPLPPEGLAPWLRRIGFYAWVPRRTPDLKAIDARFMSYIRPQRNGCWRWTGHRDGQGRPRFFYKDSSRLAHRYAYNRWRGDLPPGRHMIHICGNRLCVNPAHLELETNR